MRRLSSAESVSRAEDCEDCEDCCENCGTPGSPGASLGVPCACSEHRGGDDPSRSSPAAEQASSSSASREGSGALPWSWAPPSGRHSGLGSSCGRALLCASLARASPGIRRLWCGFNRAGACSTAAAAPPFGVHRTWPLVMGVAGALGLPGPLPAPPRSSSDVAGAACSMPAGVDGAGPQDAWRYTPRASFRRACALVTGHPQRAHSPFETTGATTRRSMLAGCRRLARLSAVCSFSIENLPR